MRIEICGAGIVSPSCIEQKGDSQLSTTKSPAFIEVSLRVFTIAGIGVHIPEFATTFHFGEQAKSVHVRPKQVFTFRGIRFGTSPSTGVFTISEIGVHVGPENAASLLPS